MFSYVKLVKLTSTYLKQNFSLNINAVKSRQTYQKKSPKVPKTR